MVDLDKYIAGAIVHGDCLERGDYRRGNRAHARMMKELGEMRKLPDRGEELLTGLLTHESPAVRSWAATDLLLSQPAVAVPVLEDLCKTAPRMLGFDCKTLLQEWRKGTFEGRG